MAGDTPVPSFISCQRRTSKLNAKLQDFKCCRRRPVLYPLHTTDSCNNKNPSYITSPEELFNTLVPPGWNESSGNQLLPLPHVVWRKLASQTANPTATPSAAPGPAASSVLLWCLATCWRGTVCLHRLLRGCSGYWGHCDQTLASSALVEPSLSIWAGLGLATLNINHTSWFPRPPAGSTRVGWLGWLDLALKSALACC